jgi:hypothetical protein
MEQSKYESSEIIIIHARKVYEMLGSIQKKPTIFLTSKSITALQDFLNGYMTLGIGNEDLSNAGDPDFPNFKYWFLHTTKQYGELGFPYKRVLLEECKGDEVKAFDRFFEYLEAYKQEEALKQNNKRT